ncbi:MAG: PHP domain-containing protein [Deltaproteobacteria bacterium]|nr:PHP domain-containing protein [Deltaproteobacteria bacterium]
MKIDLHVHTYPRSQCSKINPEDLVKKAKEIGLDGFCLTDHQVLWERADIEKLSGDSGIKIFSGNEITTAQGDVLVFGLDTDIQGIITVEELHRHVKAADAFSIAAHPFRGFKVFGFGQLQMSLDQACKKKILKYVDAVEVKNGRVTDKENDVALQVSEKLGLVATAGSDAHELDALGTYTVEIGDDVQTEPDLVGCLRSGRFTISG